MFYLLRFLFHPRCPLFIMRSITWMPLIVGAHPHNGSSKSARSDACLQGGFWCSTGRRRCVCRSHAKSRVRCCCHWTRDCWIYAIQGPIPALRGLCIKSTCLWHCHTQWQVPPNASKDSIEISSFTFMLLSYCCSVCLFFLQLPDLGWRTGAQMAVPTSWHPRSPIFVLVKWEGMRSQWWAYWWGRRLQWECPQKCPRNSPFALWELRFGKRIYARYFRVPTSTNWHLEVSIPVAIQVFDLEFALYSHLTLCVLRIEPIA